MIYLECKPEFILAKSLTGIPKREFIHERGKPKVCKQLERRRDCKGLVDEDPWSTQPPYMKKIKLKEDISEHDLKILHDNSNDNCLIVLCPRLEEWVLKTAKEASIDVRKYRLPDKAIRLHREINIDLSKFERLIGDLKNSERLKILKRLLER